MRRETFVPLLYPVVARFSRRHFLRKSLVVEMHFPALFFISLLFLFKFGARGDKTFFFCLGTQRTTLFGDKSRGTRTSADGFPRFHVKLITTASRWCCYYGSSRTKASGKHRSNKELRKNNFCTGEQFAPSHFRTNVPRRVVMKFYGIAVGGIRSVSCSSRAFENCISRKMLFEVSCSSDVFSDVPHVLWA